jgi:hypothetical protein
LTLSSARHAVDASLSIVSPGTMSLSSRSIELAPLACRRWSYHYYFASNMPPMLHKPAFARHAAEFRRHCLRSLHAADACFPVLSPSSLEPFLQPFFGQAMPLSRRCFRSFIASLLLLRFVFSAQAEVPPAAHYRSSLNMPLSRRLTSPSPRHAADFASLSRLSSYFIKRRRHYASPAKPAGPRGRLQARWSFAARLGLVVFERSPCLRHSPLPCFMIFSRRCARWASEECLYATGSRP